MRNRDHHKIVHVHRKWEHEEHEINHELGLEEVIALMRPVMVNEKLDGLELVDFLAVFEANVAYEWLHQ